MSSGVAAQASEIRKHNSNDAKCVELGWVCIPLVVETYGAWCQEAVKTFAQLASRLAIACSKPKSVVINEIYGRLNTCLMRSISSPGLCPHELLCVCNCASVYFILHYNEVYYYHVS